MYVRIDDIKDTRWWAADKHVDSSESTDRGRLWRPGYDTMPCTGSRTGHNSPTQYTPWTYIQHSGDRVMTPCLVQRAEQVATHLQNTHHERTFNTVETGLWHHALYSEQNRSQVACTIHTMNIHSTQWRPGYDTTPCTGSRTRRNSPTKYTPWTYIQHRLDIHVTALSRTTWVSRHQKGKTILHFN